MPTKAIPKPRVSLIVHTITNGLRSDAVMVIPAKPAEKNVPRLVPRRIK